LQIVLAQRWLDKNPAAVENNDFSWIDRQNRDPAVKALARFPDHYQEHLDPLLAALTPTKRSARPKDPRAPLRYERIGKKQSRGAGVSDPPCDQRPHLCQCAGPHEEVDVARPGPVSSRSALSAFRDIFPRRTPARGL